MLVENMSAISEELHIFTHYYYDRQNHTISSYRIYLPKEVRDLFWFNITVSWFLHSLKWNLVYKDINFYVCTEAWNMQHFIRNLQHDVRLTAGIGKQGETVNHNDRRNISRYRAPITLIVRSLPYVWNTNMGSQYRMFKEKLPCKKSTIEGNKVSKHEKCVLKGKETR
jgi:hypothetical protein